MIENEDKLPQNNLKRLLILKILKSFKIFTTLKYLLNTYINFK